MCSSYSTLKTTWTLYRDGRVQTQWDAPVLQDGYLEGFNATKGFYDLDVHVLADASCLNANRPRLKVVTSRDDDSFCAGVVLWAGAIFVVIGISLVVLDWRGGVFREPWAVCDRYKRAERRSTFSRGTEVAFAASDQGIPAFGLLAGVMFAIFAILMMTVTAAFSYRSRGLSVHLLKPGAVPAKPDAWTEPLIVLVRDVGPGQEPKLYLNSREVAWNDFASALKQELGSRREWTVYVEGDDNIPWADVASVVDIARGDGAKVFLVPRPDKKPGKKYVGKKARDTNQ